MSRLESEFVTVGITTFERTDLLIEALHSVLSQSHSNIRIIVANDNPGRQLTSYELGLGSEARLQVVNHANKIVTGAKVEQLSQMMSFILRDCGICAISVSIQMNDLCMKN